MSRFCDENLFSYFWAIFGFSLLWGRPRLSFELLFRSLGPLGDLWPLTSFPHNTTFTESDNGMMSPLVSQDGHRQRNCDRRDAVHCLDLLSLDRPPRGPPSVSIVLTLSNVPGTCWLAGYSPSDTPWLWAPAASEAFEGFVAGF